MSDADTAAAPVPGAAPAKTSKLVVVLIVLNLGATGFVAFRVLEPPPAAAAAHAEAAAPAPRPGPVGTLDPFIVNLNEPSSSRYLKATFELELSGKEAVEELARCKRVVRDVVLRYLSSLTVAQTLGEKGKADIQSEIVARVDKELGGGRVRRLYFTEFVVQ